MPAQQALSLSLLPENTKKTVTVHDVEILLVRTGDTSSGSPALFAVEAKCPHAQAPLEKGAVCNGRLVCPWHAGTFALDTGALLEPPPLRDLKRYPVHVEGDNILVDPSPIERETPPAIGEKNHLVFAGAGAATAAALAVLRDHNFTGRITLIEPLDQEPVDRTQLTKNALSGQKPLDSLPLFAPPNTQSGTSLGSLRIERETSSVVSLREADRSVTLSSGATVTFDALLLATGGRPKLPSISGAELPHVFTIRHPEDLRRMEPRLTPGVRVVILGDSFIALEGASALQQRGLHVTVLSQSALPFEKKFGKEIAQAILALHRSEGVHFHTGVTAAAITPVSVALEDGAEIPADVVLIAIGVEPVTKYAPGFPAGKKGGFAVDADLQLTPRIWCAGDIASVSGTRIEHWRLAEQHGRTAALGMLAAVTGDASLAAPFNGVPLFWTFHFGKRLNYIGHADTWDDLVLEGDPSSMNFIAWYLQGNTVAAVLECGRDTAMAALMEPMRQPLTLAEAQDIVSAASAA